MYPLETNMNCPHTTRENGIKNLFYYSDNSAAFPASDDLLLFGMFPKHNSLLQGLINYLVPEWVTVCSRQGMAWSCWPLLYPERLQREFKCGTVISVTWYTGEFLLTVFIYFFEMSCASNSRCHMWHLENTV